MTRSLLKPILVMTALLLAPSPNLNAQDPKSVPTENKSAPTPPDAKVAPKDTKPAPKAKTAGDPAKPAKAPVKKTLPPPPNHMVGEAPAPLKPGTKPRPKSKPKKKSEIIPYAQRIDINTASKEDLKKLPSIFDAEAAKIISHRPYKSKAGLVVDAGLTGAQYFAIKDRVIAGQVPAKP